MVTISRNALCNKSYVMRGIFLVRGKERGSKVLQIELNPKWIWILFAAAFFRPCFESINLIQECDLTSIEFSILRYCLSPPQIITLPLQITAEQYFRSLSTITLGVTLANNEQMMGGCGSDPQQVIWSASETIGPTLDHLTSQHRNSCQSTTDHLTTLDTQQRNPCQQKNKSSTHPGPRILYIKCRVWKITIKTSLTKSNVNILFYINSCPYVCLNVTLF